MVARGLLRSRAGFSRQPAVMEDGMRHFYVRAMAAKQTKQPDKVIDAAMIQAVQIADGKRVVTSVVSGSPVYRNCE